MLAAPSPHLGEPGRPSPRDRPRSREENAPEDHVRVRPPTCLRDRWRSLSSSPRPSPLSREPSRQVPQASDVEDLIRRGNELRRRGLDGKVLPLFQQAYELAGTPRTAAQLGLCALQLGYAVEAEQHISEALAASQDPWVRQYREALTTALRTARSRIAEVVVLGSPAGAEVVVNGRSAGRFPLSEAVRVGEGAVKIEVRASGYTDRRVSLMVKGERREEITIDLPPNAQPPPTATPSPAFGRVEAPSRGSVLPRSDQDERRAGSSEFPRWPAWGTGIAAAGLLIFGVTQTIAHERNVSRFDSQKNPFPDGHGGTALQPACSLDQADRGGTECQRMYEDIQRTKTLATVGYVAAGTMAVTSGLLFLLSRKQSEASALACGPGLLYPSAVCRMSF